MKTPYREEAPPKKEPVACMEGGVMRCRTPGWWARSRLGVKDGDRFVCQKCGRIWFWDSEPMFSKWNPGHIGEKPFAFTEHRDNV